MAEEALDKLLSWDFIGFYCKDISGGAQIIRPALDYDAYYFGVPLSLWREGYRGSGYIQLEEVDDLHLAGQVLARALIHSDEIGTPTAPAWVYCMHDAIKLSRAKYYRIVAYAIPPWEYYAEDLGKWVPANETKPFVWPFKRGSSGYPRGYRQIGYNFQTRDVPWHDVPDSDFPFIIGGVPLDQYTLSTMITPLEGGDVLRSPAKSVYAPGDEVTLTAIANEGYTFVSWAGDVTGEDPEITITMDGSKTVMANFVSSGIPDIPIISDIVKWLVSLFHDLYAWIADHIISPLTWVKEKLQDAWEWVSIKIPEALSWITEKLGDAWEWVSTKIPEALSWITEKLEDAWEWVSTKIPDALAWIIGKLEDAWEWVSTKIPEVLEWVKEKLQDAWEWVSIKIPEALTWIKGKLLDAWEWITEAIPQVLEWAGNILSQVWEFILKIKDAVLAFFADPFGWVRDNIIEPMLSTFNSGFERALDEEETKED